MRLHRFFIDHTIGDKKEVIITQESLLHQWKKVFRYAPSDQVILFDNSGYEYTARIEYFEPREAQVVITGVSDKNGHISPDVYLYASLTKKDTFEWVLEKTTELGITRIIPIVSERSEKKGLNFDRAKKILVEASEQSGRVVVPRLYEITEFADALTQYDISKITFDPTGESFAHALKNKDSILNTKPLAIFVGPEGGWSPKELELFRVHKIPVYSLGAQILRAETACIAIVSLVLLRETL